MDLCSEDTYPAAKPTTHSESHSAWDVNLIFDGTRHYPAQKIGTDFLTLSIVMLSV